MELRMQVRRNNSNRLGARNIHFSILDISQMSASLCAALRSKQVAAAIYMRWLVMCVLFIRQTGYSDGSVLVHSSDGQRPVCIHH